MITTHDGPGAANTRADEAGSGWAAGPEQRNAGEQAFVSALYRRRAAALRCPPLEDGHADPHHDHGRGDGRVSPAEVHSWRAAWAHLRVLGYVVDVPAAVVAAGERERS